MAGVAALILSVNPNLTQLKVREYLEINTDKITGYTYTNTSGKPNGIWNDQVGYGRINANKAVQNALPKIAGPTTFCPSGTFSVSVPSGGNVAWSVSPSNALSFTQGSASTTFSRIGSFSGAATITAIITSSYQPMTLTKTVNVIGHISMTWNGTGPYGQVDVSVSGGSAPYKFYKNGALIKTSSSSSVTLAFGCDGGVLKAEANTACGTASVSDIVMSGCANLMSQQSMVIFPNPSSSDVFVKIKEEENSSTIEQTELNRPKLLSPIILELYDLNGVLVLENEFAKMGPETKINVSHLKKGIYFLRIVAKEVDEVHQIVVE